MTTLTRPSCHLGQSTKTSTQTGQWFVLQTKSRHEKALAQSLDAMHVTYYLPLVDQVRMHGGRRARVQMPLFPGYLFLQGSRDDAYTADRTRRVAQIIDVPDQQRLAEELNNIRLALTSSQPLDPYPYLKAGVRVVVRCGPLQGMTGRVESRTQLDRLILQVDVLGQACSLEVDGAILDVMD